MKGKHPNSAAAIAPYRMSLGDSQLAILRSMLRTGYKIPGDNPGTRKAATLRIMETLTKRGLVTKTLVPMIVGAGTRPRYDLTDEGRRVAQEKP